MSLKWKRNESKSTSVIDTICLFHFRHYYAFLTTNCANANYAYFSNVSFDVKDKNEEKQNYCEINFE